MGDEVEKITRATGSGNGFTALTVKELSTPADGIEILFVDPVKTKFEETVYTEATKDIDPVVK